MEHWHKACEGLVPIRWVYVHDKTGTHRDDYFFTTDLKLTPRQIIFTGRWSIETMFQEVRAYLGLETTCGWTQKTVLRAAPALFGLYTLVVPARWQEKKGTTTTRAMKPCPQGKGKSRDTSSRSYGER